MNTYFKSIFALLLFISPLTHGANIVASIKPLQLIALEITKGVNQPDLLINSTASPHDYAMKPSDLKKIRSADLVIWFGPELESFLNRTIGDSENSLQLSAGDVELREFESGAHDGHNHGNYDPHIWLGPEQAMQTAKAISARLSLIDKDNADKYASNLDEFLLNLESKTMELKSRLKPYQDAGYYVFHDAYGYFESYFKLNNLGHFTVSPERKPGAKTLIRIRTALKQGEAKCVFSEPQFKPAVVDSVTRGSDVYQGVLDPLASDVEATEGAYFRFLDNLADSYINCLSYQG